jgi:peptide/nickel transport system substrate-binding protein
MKGFSIVKGVLTLLILSLVGMMYWSSLLQEDDLKKVRQELKELHLEMASLGQKLSRELQHVERPAQERATPLANLHLPNLLQEDPYYTKTLPSLLKENFLPKGILKRALIGKPANLHPFNGLYDVAHMVDMCTSYAADLKVGYYETFTPRLAVKLEARERPDIPEIEEYWVHLRDDVYWEPLNQAHFPDSLQLAPQFFERHLVTAQDFKFFYDAVMNPYIHEAKAVSLRSYFNDIEEFIVINDTTFVVRWKPHITHDESGKEVKKVKYTARGWTSTLQPLPRFVFQYFADGQKIIEEDTSFDTYRKNSIWAQNFTHHWAKNVIVSCGPYLFDGMTDEGISFKRNPHYFNPYAVLVEGVKYTFKESMDAIWQDFKAGKIDLCSLSTNQLMELKGFLESDDYRIQCANHQAIHTLDYIDLSYFYIGWNLSSPFFSDERVRKAMTLAIDRGRIIEQNLNLMAVAITGPFFCFSPAYDTSIPSYPYNPEEACHLLEEAGWVDSDGDGIRDRVIEGEKVPFRFKLNYYVKNHSAKVIAEYVMTALRGIGIQCEISGLDVTDMSRQFDNKSFDAIYFGWKLGTPPEDPRQLWHSSGAKEKGSSNAVGFANPDIDNIIELLHYEYDKSKRIDLYHQFHQIIHREAPYTFLYTPKVRLVYRESLHNLFVPQERQDLFPGATMATPYFDTVYKDDLLTR